MRNKIIALILFISSPVYAGMTPWGVDLDWWGYLTECNPQNVSYDQAGGGRDLTFQGGFSWSLADRFGCAGFGDGVNDRAEGAASDAFFNRTVNDSFSMGVCFQTDLISGANVDNIIGRITAGDNGYSLRSEQRETGSRFVLFLGGTQFQILGIANIESTRYGDNRWHCIAATYNGNGATSGMKLYLDSSEPAARGFDFDNGSPTMAGLNFAVASGDSGSQAMKGKFQLPFFTKRVISDGDIGAWMDYFKRTYAVAEEDK